MNYYKIPLVRKLIFNLKAKNQNFEKYKFGPDGVRVVLLSMDLCLTFSQDGYCQAYPLRLKSLYLQKPFFICELKHLNQLSTLGLKLENFGLISPAEATKYFEVDRQEKEFSLQKFAA